MAEGNPHARERDIVNSYRASVDMAYRSHPEDTLGFLKDNDLEGLTPRQARPLDVSPAAQLKGMVRDFMADLRSVVSGSVLDGRVICFQKKTLGDYGFEAKMVISIPSNLPLDGVASILSKNVSDISAKYPSVNFGTVVVANSSVSIPVNYTFPQEIIDLDQKLLKEISG